MAKATKIKKGDTGPPFTATLTDGDGTAQDLTGATSVTFLMKHTRTRDLEVSAVMTITDATAGKVSYVWAAGDTDTPGAYDVEIQVVLADASIVTFPNNGFHRLEVLRDLGP